MAGICKAKGRRKAASKGKRNIQNQRTYINIQKRRAKHAKNHRFESVEVFEKFIGARRWTTKPTAKT